MATEAVGNGGDGFLFPRGDEESKGFWEGTFLGELRLQVCGSCGTLRFPPRPMCPHCQATARHWRRVRETGTIWSFVVCHPPLLPAYAALVLYPVVTVALDEGPGLRMVGNIVTRPDGAINEVDPATIVIGEPVRAVFSRRRGPDNQELFLPSWVRQSGPPGEKTQIETAK